MSEKTYLRVEYVKKVLKVVTALVCAALFIVHFYGVFKDYTNGETIVATKFVPLGSMLLPTLAFCLQVGYKNATELPLTVSHYKNVTIDPWEFVLNISALVNNSRIDFRSHPEKWRVRELYTIFHGRCLTVRSKVKV